MVQEPTYEELRKRIKESERELVKCRELERTLRDSEERYRTLFENANDAVFIADVTTGVILDANKEAERLTGHSRSEIIGVHQTGRLHLADQVEDYKEKLRKHIKNNQTANFEAEILKKDGTTVPVLISASVMDLQGRKVIRGIFHDITEHKRLEEELKVEESAIASAINAIAFADIEGNLTYVNDSFLTLWGYDENEVLGKPAVSFWQAEDKAAEVIDALRATGGWIGELVAKRKDGSLVDTQVSASLVTGDEGKPICMMASFVDITDRRRAEEALRKAHDELEQRVEERTAELAKTNDELMQEIEQRKRIEAALLEKQAALKAQNISTVRKSIELSDVKRELEDRNYDLGLSRAGLEEAMDALRKAHDKLESRVEQRTAELMTANRKLRQQIENRRLIQKKLKEREAALEARKNELEEVNTALRVLLKQREEDRANLEQRVMLNIKARVIPHIQKLRRTRLHAKQTSSLNMVESNLSDVISPFGQQLSSRHFMLTPAEVEIAHLIRDGNRTKEMAKMLNLSRRTVEFHRANIRRKLGIKSQKANLRSHLRALE